MKNTLMKVWGIVLTVAILAGLIIVAVPVSAATTQYSVVNTPTAFTTAGTVDFLVASKDGTTMFAYDNTNKILYKSTNGGVVFAPTSAPTTTNNNLDGNIIEAIAISSTYATDNTVMVATLGGLVLLSTNGGTNFFSAFGFAAPAGATITSVALATGATGVTYAVGTTTGGGFGGKMYLFDPTSFSWVDQATAGLPAGNVVGVAFSPNYSVDGQAFAVTVASATAAQVNQRAVSPGSVWNNLFGATAFAPTTTAMTKASFGFATDYANYSGSFVLGISGTAIDDAYLVTPSAPPSTSMTRLNITVVNGVASNTPVASISINGALSAGVYAGLNSGAVVKGTGISGATVTWTAPAAPQLGGGNAKVVAVAGGIYAGCVGGGFKSAVYISKDDTATFQPLSLISVSSPANLTVKSMAAADTKTIFLMLTEAGGDILFKTADGGADWSAVYISTTQSLLGVYLSPAYATDSTVYVPNNNPIQILKSTNGGASFIPQVVGNPGTPITAFVAADGTNYYAGYQTYIYKSNRFIQAANITLTPLSLPTTTVIKSLSLAGSVVFAGTSDGNVLMSTDDALTFSFVPAQSALGSGTINVVADPVYAATKTIYASSSAKTGIYAFTVGVSPAWSAVGGAATINSISLDSGGNVYAGDTGVASITRILNPSLPSPGALVDSIGSNLASATTSFGTANQLTNVVALTDGTNVTILSVANNIPAVAPIPYTFAVMSFTDNCIGAPSGVKASSVSVVNQSVFTWNAYPAVFVPGPVYYDAQIAYDNTFAPSSVFIDDSGKNALNANVLRVAGGNFQAGQTYYVRVRVSTSEPLVSNWTTGIQFTTPITEPGSSLSNVGNIAPAPGSIITNTKTPTFAWAAVAAAVSYDVQIFSTPDFSGTPLNGDNGDGLTVTVYTSNVSLDPGTYYWRVRAVAGTVVGNWVESSFTIANAPTQTTGGGGTVTVTVPTPTITIPTITIPTQTVTVVNPTPTFTLNQGTTATPAWTWVLIVIGAVLVIAVIVLIVRTRRV